MKSFDFVIPACLKRESRTSFDLTISLSLLAVAGRIQFLDSRLESAGVTVSFFAKVFSHH